MERTLEQNLADALEAVRFVKSKMRLGARNQIGDLWRSRGGSIDCISDMRSDIETYAGTLKGHFAESQSAAHERLAEFTAAAAVQYGCGNCDEQAALAFIFLRDKGVFPIDWVDMLGLAGGKLGGHSFVVIGRVKKAIKPADWGPTAVVCDPHEPSNSRT